ncbi:MAG: hypothetical protein WC934_06035 [Acidithiobacillus sp.]|uniref:hypothetical protein n=1 Tax=Acidithiobacillus sp. TaxID=1872118 RepID=UPI00355D7AC7
MNNKLVNVKIPIHKYTSEDPRSLISMIKLEQLNTQFPSKHISNKFFEILSENDEKFYQGCINISQSAIEQNKGWKQASGKLNALSIVYKNKNPKNSIKSKICRDIINYEGYDVKSQEIKDLEKQGKSKFQIRKILKQHIKSII